MTTCALHQVLLGEGKSTVAVTFLTSAGDVADATTYNGTSFQGLAFGPARADRFIVMGIASRANAARSISSATINGNAATAVVTANDSSGGADISALWIAPVPEAVTTGDVSITFSAQMLRCSIVLWHMVGVSIATAFATMSDTSVASNVYSGTIDCPANGAVVGMSLNSQGSGNATATWAGLSRDVAATTETVSFGYSGAHSNFSTSQSGLTVSETGAATVANGGLAVAAFGP